MTVFGVKAGACWLLTIWKNEAVFGDCGGYWPPGKGVNPVFRPEYSLFKWFLAANEASNGLPLDWCWDWGLFEGPCNIAGLKGPERREVGKALGLIEDWGWLDCCCCSWVIEANGGKTFFWLSKWGFFSVESCAKDWSKGFGSKSSWWLLGSLVLSKIKNKIV